MYRLVSIVMGLMGTVLSTGAYAAGVHGLDVLAMLFVMGACGSLCLMLLWYRSRLEAASAQ